MSATDGLNKAQLEAVTHDRGPLMVLAGPGTGKTRVIAHRIAHMVLERSIAPESIVAVTYTVKAAQQLRERLAALIGPDADAVHAHTFHGLGLRIIRRFADEAGVRPSRMDDGRGGIIDSAQTSRLLRSIVNERNLFRHARAEGMEAVIERIIDAMSALADAGLSPDDALDFASETLQRLAQGQDYAGNLLDADAVAAELKRIQSLEQSARAIEVFEIECRERGWLTFGDLITLPIRTLRLSGRAAVVLRDEWRHLVVDEFQDVNAAQIELLRLLAPPAAAGRAGQAGPDLCVVGDDDQAIYEFRGADDRAFQRFSRLWTGHATVKLSDNYRSAPPIVHVANSIIRRAGTRYAPDKRIDPAREPRPGEPALPRVECIHLENDFQDGELIAAMILTDRTERAAARWSDYAVVVRNNIDADRVYNALRIEGVPAVAARELSPADDEGVKDVLAWIQLLAEPHAVHAAARILMRPPFSIDARVFLPMTARFRAQSTRFEAGEPEAQNPGCFPDWLERNLADDPAIARFAAIHRELHRFAAESSAAEVVFRAVIAADAAHADLPTERARSARVANLVGLVKFARERQGRLEPPGDVRAFWAYYEELSDDERRMRDPNLGARVDGIGELPDDEGPDAVRLITAHSAKGLEFDTVFVPRVSPNHGYGSIGREDEPSLPAGLVPRDGPLTPRQRAEAEQRRVFYVACTRAERRLILLSKKTKGPSRSDRHYFQEIVRDETLKNDIQVREWADVLGRAGTLGLGQSYGWSRPSATGLDVEAAGYKTVEHRKSVFEQARREVRTLAARALDSAAGGSADAAHAAGDALRSCARRLALLSEAESSGHVPSWADGADRAHTLAVLNLAGADPAARTAGAASPNAPRPPLRLSYTYINAYLECPRCFYLKRVLGLPEVPRPAEMVGRAVHIALQRFYIALRQRESEGSEPPTRDQLIAMGRNAFFEVWPRQLETDRDQLDKVQAQLGLVHDRLHDPRANVVEIERAIVFPYGPHSCEARIDRIDRYTQADGIEAFRIIDYKTGRPRETLRSPPRNDLQLGIYLLALEHLYGQSDVPGVAEYWLLATGERGRIALGDIDRDKIRATIDGAIEGILAGRFASAKDCRGDCRLLGEFPDLPIPAAAARPETHSQPSSDEGV